MMERVLLLYIAVAPVLRQKSLNHSFTPIFQLPSSVALPSHQSSYASYPHRTPIPLANSYLLILPPPPLLYFRFFFHVLPSSVILLPLNSFPHPLPPSTYLPALNAIPNPKYFHIHLLLLPISSQLPLSWPFPYTSNACPLTSFNLYSKQFVAALDGKCEENRNVLRS